MVDSVWADLGPAEGTALLAAADRGRRESEPGLSSGVSDSTIPKALDIAVPGGFQSHHVQTPLPRADDAAARGFQGPARPDHRPHQPRAGPPSLAAV
ncbi:unnamed protein product [Phytophthora fragariaefolia]|uniref:Unnamed protein product n=1 Tax=Phytophthora fragariaefolia TaxID=1490495 RepID=A0A9W6X2U3_9STRA|nr:unnamed protein product [Phytophthora fragariaefolia]